MSEDERLARAFEALDPSPDQVDRMKSAVLAAYAPLPPLSAEWLTLLRARPIANTVFTFAAAAVLLLGVAISAIPWSLLSGLGAG